jgi:hypothetical protein
VDNVIGFVDGLSLRVQCSDSKSIRDDIIMDIIMILAVIMFLLLLLMVKLFMLVLISQDLFMIPKYLQSYNQSSLKRLDNMRCVLIKESRATSMISQTSGHLVSRVGVCAGNHLGPVTLALVSGAESRVACVGCATRYVDRFH